MKPSIKPELKSLLFMALEEEYGIIVRETVSGAAKLQKRLQVLRRTDPLFSVLSFALSPTDPEHELWIVRAKDWKEVEPDGEEI